MRGNAQHQLEEVYDWAVFLKYFRSILLEFDTDCTLRKRQYGCTFYDNLGLLIKSWINKVGKQQMS